MLIICPQGIQSGLSPLRGSRSYHTRWEIASLQCLRLPDVNRLSAVYREAYKVSFHLSEVVDPTIPGGRWHPYNALGYIYVVYALYTARYTSAPFPLKGRNIDNAHPKPVSNTRFGAPLHIEIPEILPAATKN